MFALGRTAEHDAWEASRKTGPALDAAKRQRQAAGLDLEDDGRIDKAADDAWVLVVLAEFHVYPRDFTELHGNLSASESTLGRVFDVERPNIVDEFL